MTEPRIDNQNQRPRRPRSPVIRSSIREIDLAVNQKQSESKTAEKLQPDAADNHIAEKGWTDPGSPVIRGNDREIDRIDRHYFVDRMPTVSRRSTVADIHDEDKSLTASIRGKLGGSMTKITDFYRRGNIIDAESQRKAGHRVFRLKGYTTVGKINRKFKQERQQRALRNILTTLMVILLLIILFVIYNPFKDLSEFRKISGEDSLYKNRTTTTILSEETTEINIIP